MVNHSVSQRIKQLQIKTRKILSGTMLGDRSTATKGSGLEFDQLREYQSGDDLRFIDWRATAKTGRLLTREYFEERNHNILIALDISSSSFKYGKHSYMSELAAIFALVAEYGKDMVGLVLFSDQIHVEKQISGGGCHTFKILETIFNFTQPVQPYKTDLSCVFDYLKQKIKCKCLVIIISDFIDYNNYQRLLKAAVMRHEIVAIRCLDEMERSLPDVGIIPVIDPETGAMTTLDTRTKFGAGLKGGINYILHNRVEAQNQFFKRNRIDLLQINNWQQMVPEVIKFFRKRLIY